MKILKSIIIVLIVLCVIGICALLFINKKDDNYIKESEEDELLRIAGTSDLNTELQLLNSRIDYLTLKNCIKQYQNSVNTIVEEHQNNKYTSELKNEKIEKMYSMLDKEYVDFNEITKDNLLEYCKSESEFYIDCIYTKEISSEYSIYLIYGRERDIYTNAISKSGYIVKLKSSNLTFSIFPYDYMEMKKLDKEKIDVALDTADIERQNIEETQYNKYTIILANDEKIAQEHFDKYINDLVYNKEYLYETLDSEYKTKKFKDYGEFEDYINSNIALLKEAVLTKYQVESIEDYIQYTCIDQNNNYYIFRDKGIMNYTLILDVYTVNLPEFNSKYKSTSEQGKMALNIDRFFRAINEKSYYFAYNLLADTFKNSNFNTQEEFENYVQKNFYQNNKIEYESFLEQTGLYTYEIRIINADDISQETKKTIIMKLKDKTNFEMSFSVN